MKVLICSTEYYPHGSGIANVAYNVVEQFKNMGINCTVCSPTGPDLRLGSQKMIEIFGVLGLVYYWYCVSKYFKKNTFDGYVWMHNPLFLREDPFKRSLVTMHTTYCGKAFQYGKVTQRFSSKIYVGIVSKIERYCLNKMNKETKFTSVSPEVRKELEQIGINGQRINYIPNGVDTEIFKPLSDKKEIRLRFEIPEDNLILLSLGLVSEPKQPYNLIDVFSLIQDKIKDVTLVIAGEGELLKPLKNLVRKNNLKNIIFLGHVDYKKEVPSLYSCSDYYIMASKYEGQPLTLLEAMSSGLPCIVSNIKNLKIVLDADCGIIVDFNDIGKATEKIVDYLQRNNSNHSKNARQYALNNLGWTVVVKKYLDEIKLAEK